MAEVGEPSIFGIWRSGADSLFELQTYLELAREMKWVDGEDLAAVARLADEVDRIVSALLRSLKRRRP
jgi:hypothetical protein